MCSFLLVIQSNENVNKNNEIKVLKDQYCELLRKSTKNIAH